ncbi:MAG: TonB-dependent receptor [bacterium]
MNLSSRCRKGVRNNTMREARAGNRIMHPFLWLSILAVLAPLNLSASQTGKIAGVVTDEQGNPLPGANIVVEGSNLGAATDLDGRYYILALQPGRRTLIFSALGYANLRMEDVPVISGQTTMLDARLREEALQLEEVTVIFQKPPVELNETSQRISVEGDIARQMPIRQADEMVNFQAGAATDASGQLHIRGGRSGEVGFFIDGMRVEDPLYGEQQQQVGREALQEMQLLSGTFSAEYGEAMSGIVNLITREGGDHYRWSMEYESPMVNSSPYREKDWARSGSDAVRDTITDVSLYEPTSINDTQNLLIPVPGRLSATLSGPIPLLVHGHFFINGVHEAEDSYLPFGDRMTRNTSGKLTWEPPVGKLALSFGFREANYQNYSHAWKYVPDHYHRHFENSARWSLNWTHQLNNSLFYEVTGGYFWRRHDVKIFEEWSDYVSHGYQPQDFTFASYFYGDSDWSNTWREGRTITSTASSKLTWQMNPVHQWRGGAEVKEQNIQLDEIRQLTFSASGKPRGLRDTYTQKPLETAMFLQDKIELDYLIVNAGLRWDYVDPRAKGWSDPENPTIQLETVKPSSQVSPRIGLAHPISDRLTLYFSYGHFFQFPDYVSLFLNSADLNPDTLANRTFDAVGNPGIRPQKTVAYEVGLKGIMTDIWGFTATAFYKDITDLVGTRQVRYGSAYNYAAFVNIDYASVIGFEVGLTRSLADHWSLQANYTYSVAKGNSSEPTSGYWDAYEGIPTARQEYYMDFDRRHVANAMITWQSGWQNYPRLSGTSLLRGASAGLIVSASSGLPYTPYTGAGEQLAQRNSERMPAILTVNLRAAKLLLDAPVKVSLFANIDNLFDRINPFYVDSRTGEPWETTLVGNEILYDQMHDPSRVDRPRTVRVGLTIER